MSASLTLLQAGNGEREPALLPVGWQVKPLSRVFRQISSGTTPPTDEPGYYGNDVHWVTTGELRETAIQSSKAILTNAAIQKFSALRIYPAGTLLIAMYGATVGRMGWLEVPAATNQACCALVDAGSGSARFVFYCLLAAMESILILSAGGGQPNINQEKLRSFQIPQPPSTLQHIIAAFLDRETGKIDALVEEQERLIALLKEKRQAVISQAVTKGLDPTVPMKHSGVEWLGEVPAHWDVRSIASLTTKITNGYVGPTRDILVDEGVRYIQSLHIKQNKIQFNAPYFVRPDWSEAHKKSVLAIGDVLVVQTGDIGQVAVVGPDFAGCNCHALIILAPRSGLIYGSWLAWVLNSTYGVQSLLAIQTGALHPHLNCGNVRELLIPVAPLDEQDAIISIAEERMANVDSLIAEAKRGIALLRERRAALIAAAVTGKIDVHEHGDMLNVRAA